MKTDLEMVRAVFRTEATELISGMETAFLMLETVAGPEVFEPLFRSVHTLKGNALLMGFPAASELAHVVEDLLEKIAARAVPITPDVVNLLLRAVDGLRVLIGVPNEGTDASVDPAEVQRQLAQAAGTAVSEGALPGPGPEPQPLVLAGQQAVEPALDLQVEPAEHARPPGRRDHAAASRCTGATCGAGTAATTRSTTCRGSTPSASASNDSTRRCARTSAARSAMSTGNT